MTAITFTPFDWPSETPEDCPFPPSPLWRGIRFMGRCSDYRVGDTFYPTWGADDVLYSPFTDGAVDGLFSWSSGFVQGGEPVDNPQFTGGFLTRRATTGHARLVGDDPLNLRIEPIGLHAADPYPYGGRYPCGSLHHEGVWYYGTYCLSPYAETPYGGQLYNWPHLGPLVGFRISRDNGRTWVDTPHTPARPLFGECGLCGYPVKIGAPHFVDFGRNMEHSPDGFAYLVAQGSDLALQPGSRFGHLSWITADQVYLLRVRPTPETINDPGAYEFYAGQDEAARPRWSGDFREIRPLLEWKGRMGCVTATWLPAHRRFILCVTDGGNTCSHMHTYFLEAEALTGPWRMVSYLRNFGQQAYFVNIPSKFLRPDSESLWIAYSGNFAPEWNGERIEVHPPGTRYGLVLQEVRFQERLAASGAPHPTRPR
ncbi:MAG: hypothetical protein JJT96_06090 [Opitutales bacterium]|nr:hypothetical protein [Opitutales bacterium]